MHDTVLIFIKALLVNWSKAMVRKKIPLRLKTRKKVPETVRETVIEEEPDVQEPVTLTLTFHFEESVCKAYCWRVWEASIQKVLLIEFPA